MVYMKNQEANAVKPRKKVRIPHIIEAKGKAKLSAITCYDATFARLVEKAPIDVVLVGDSLGHVIQGGSSTIPVTTEDIAYHVKAVASTLKTPHLVADIPFGQVGLVDADCFASATKLMQAGAESVKIEGATKEILHQIEVLSSHGIPVMGHLGLTPQSVHSIGGYRVQGKSEENIKRLVKDAKALEKAGCFAIVLELCTAEAGKTITESVSIPTIGIGSGADCDGQILVLQDMLGMNLDFKPKFLKHFENLEERVTNALSNYDTEVKNGQFPE